MPYEFKFPDVGEGIQEGELVKWLVNEGDAVEADQHVAEVETDKAIVEMPAPKKGTIAKLHYKEGDTIQVGSVFVTIALEGESVDTASAPAQEQPEQAAPAEEQSMPPPPPPPAQEAPQQESSDVPLPSSETAQPVQGSERKLTEEEKAGGKYTGSVVGFLEEADEVTPIHSAAQSTTTQSAKVKATLKIRKLAKDKGVDLSTVAPTGEGGRVTEQDVLNAAGSAQQAAPAAQPAAAPAAPPQAPAQQTSSQPQSEASKVKHTRKYDFFGYLDRKPLKGVKKKVAEHMTQSFYTAPQVTNFHSADISKIEEQRRQQKEQGVHVTALAFITKAVSQVLQNHLIINSILEDEEVVSKKYYNIGIAVDTEGGLMVPVVKRANTKSITQLADEIKKLSTEARDRKINLMDLKGGTFTISNLGGFGVEHFTPILNYPETALLGVGRAKTTLAVTNKDPVNKKINIGEKQMLPLSFTYDHRVISGADAARFMKDLVDLLENPENIEQ